jgi:hypothetical protein
MATILRGLAPTDGGPFAFRTRDVTAHTMTPSYWWAEAVTAEFSRVGRGRDVDERPFGTIGPDFPGQAQFGARW